MLAVFAFAQAYRATQKEKQAVIATNAERNAKILASQEAQAKQQALTMDF